MGVAVARVRGELLKDGGVELMEGGDGGDDDAEILFEASPECHRRTVP